MSLSNHKHNSSIVAIISSIMSSKHKKSMHTIDFYAHSTSTIEQGETRANQLIADILYLAFKLGFASIFLVNALVAIVHPEDFKKLLELNRVAQMIGFTDAMIVIAMVNDALIGVCILLGRWKLLVYAWAGLWLLLVAVLKLMNIVTG